MPYRSIRWCTGLLALGLCLALLAGVSLPATGAEATADRERQIRAALVYKVARFVTWPASAFHGPDEFGFCFVGDAGAAQSLAGIAGRRIQNRRARVQRVADNEALAAGRCNLLYLINTATLAPEALAAAEAASVLVVADGTQQGAMIQMIQRDNRIRLTIDLGRVRAAQLRVDAPLLQMVEVRQ
jgi:hypothetical protein